jgi:hypothetical protein
MKFKPKTVISPLDFGKGLAQPKKKAPRMQKGKLVASAEKSAGLIFDGFFHPSQKMRRREMLRNLWSIFESEAILQNFLKI